MSASVVLELDTTAPDVTWGAVAGTTASELLQVAYVSDEPFASAELKLADDRVLAATITPTALQVLLPIDTPTGMALLTALDEVGNRTDPYPIALTGTAGPAVRRSRPGPTGRAPMRQSGATRIIYLAERAGGRSRTTTASSSRPARVVARTRGRARATRDAVRSRSVARAGAALRLPQAEHTPIRRGALGVTSHGHTIRRDGQALEEALLLELL